MNANPSQQPALLHHKFHTTAASENIHSPGSHANASPLITTAVTLQPPFAPLSQSNTAPASHSATAPALHASLLNMWSVVVRRGRLGLMPPGADGERQRMGCEGVWDEFGRG